MNQTKRNAIKRALRRRLIGDRQLNKLIDQSDSAMRELAKLITQLTFSRMEARYDEDLLAISVEVPSQSPGYEFVFGPSTYWKGRIYRDRRLTQYPELEADMDGKETLPVMANLIVDAIDRRLRND